MYTVYEYRMNRYTVYMYMLTIDIILSYRSAHDILQYRVLLTQVHVHVICSVANVCSECYQLNFCQDTRVASSTYTCTVSK